MIDSLMDEQGYDAVDFFEILQLSNKLSLSKNSSFSYSSHEDEPQISKKSSKISRIKKISLNLSQISKKSKKILKIKSEKWILYIK